MTEDRDHEQALIERGADYPTLQPPTELLQESRSPEHLARMVRMVASQVRARATSSTGLIIPLIAGIAVRAVEWLPAIELDSVDQDDTARVVHEAKTEANVVLGLLDRDAWDADDLALLKVEEFASKNWVFASVGIPRASLEIECGLPPTTPFATLAEAVTHHTRSRLAGQDGDLLSALVALTVVAHSNTARKATPSRVGGKKKWANLSWSRHPLLGDSLRPLHTVIADTVRARSTDISWSTLLRDAYHATSATRLLGEMITIGHHLASQRSEIQALRSQHDQERSAAADERRAAEARERLRAREIETRIRAEYEHRLTSFAQERAAALEEARAARERAARATTHAATLRSEYEALEQQCAILEAAIAGATPSQDLPEPATVADATPATPLADAWRGHRVIIMTNQARGSARADMERRARVLGADRVEVYWTNRSRGPDPLPEDAIVIVDVSFMPHSDSEAIRDAARRAGCFHFEGRHGASTLCEAAAAAWLKSRGSIHSSNVHS